MSKQVTVIDRQALAEAAREARRLAYAPYSHYYVGAALLAADGTIFAGCNVENASYPACICAERVAISKAVSEGYQEFLAIAVATQNGGTPCGICRQVMNEFAPDMRVIVANKDDILADYSLSDLLPHGFGPENLLD